MPLEPYMVAFDYGSVVFFNTPREVREHCMTVLQVVANDPVKTEDRPYTEGRYIYSDFSMFIWVSCILTAFMCCEEANDDAVYAIANNYCTNP